MATKRWSELAAALTAALGDEVVGLKDGVNVRFSLSLLVDLIDALTNPMTAAGDLIVGGVDGEPTRLALGTNTYVLKVVDGALTWAPEAGAGSGTGLLNPMTAKNDLIIGADAGTAVRLPGGLNNTFLSVVDGELVWTNVAPGTGMANPLAALGDILVGIAGGAPGRLPAGTAGQVLTMVDGVPTWVDRPSSIPTVVPLSTNRLLSLADAGKYLRFTGAASQIVTVPTQASVAWADSTEITFEQSGLGLVSFTATTGVTINKAAGHLARIKGQYGVACLKRVATNVWTLFGNLETP